MSYPSYYFTLFKKFQSLGHVAEGTAHGNVATPQSGVSFTDPLALLTASIPTNIEDAQGNVISTAPVALIGTTTSNTPLWGVLNAKALTSGPFAYPAGNTKLWFPMPTGNRAAWNDAAVGGPALVQAFADWLAAGKPQDFPSFIVKPNAGSVPGPLDAGGASVFVCSSASDDGTRPGSVPSDYWATSLIYLSDPATGAQANPPTLTAGTEYHVAAVIGNRGDAVGGKYGQGPSTAVSPGIQATAWAMTFGTGGSSPAVELPSLSNLDLAATSSINDIYFLPSAKYDIVGFRLPVRAVFNGLVSAIDDAVAHGVFTLPGNLSAQQWLTSPPSHVCLKVAVRRDDQSWPSFDDSPLLVPQIAQKNLVVFDVDVLTPAPAPMVHWKYFTMGGPLAALLRTLRRSDTELGANTLVLRSDFARRAARVMLAIPRTTFERWIGKDGFRGFKVVDGDTRHKLRVPFEDHVLLAQSGDTDAIRIPYLDNHVLPMAIGVEMDVARLKPGTAHRVSIEHRALVPRFGRGKQQRCYTPEDAVVGGFTLEFRVDGAIKKGPKSKG